MEFACGFVYVPPPKDSQQVFKRSALLPPVSWVRPVRAPPPPPLEIKEVKVGESPPTVGQRPHKNKRQGRPTSTSTFYDNVDFESTSPKQLTPTRKTASAPLLPPRPSLMKYMPEYVVLLPTSSTTEKTPLTPPPATPPPATEDKRPLPGNPNVILVSLGKLLSEKVQHTQGKPTFCSQCGSVLDYTYDNLLQAKGCYFCEPPERSSAPSAGLQHGLFALSPSENLTRASSPLLIFCIDISASMSITSQVLTAQESIHRSRLEFVQEAVLLCVQKLSKQQPDTPVGLITFNYEVTVHGCGDFPSHVLSGDELTDSENLKAAASVFTTPAPLSYTKKFLREQVSGLSAVGITALGPAALVAITMASRHPGSKVIICTDGKANTPLGESGGGGQRRTHAPLVHNLLPGIGEDAANQGVTVSVLSIEGTDCRLDELGRLADRTGGKVVVVNPGMLQSEFEQIIENNTIATKCTVTLIVPTSLRMRGEKEAGHKAVRKVGNVHLGKEITFQFVANESDVAPLPSGGAVSIQLQLRYMPKNGQMTLRVFTMTRNVTHESLVALTSLSLPIIQLNSSQASAALAVRGRFLDARRESEQQMKLIERAIEHNRSAEDRQTYKEWVITMEPIYNNIFDFTRAKSVVSDSQSLTDAGAALLYTMKQSNRKTIMIKNHHNLHFSPHWKQSKS